MISLNAESIFVLAGLVFVFIRAQRGPQPSGRSIREDRLDGIALALLALTTIAFFSWTARSYFLADDFILLAQAHAPLSWRAVFATRGGDGAFRPAGFLAYAISAKWAGYDPSRWHWIGLSLHMVNAGVLYALALEIGYSGFLAWFGATLFALYGAHPEAVVWMAGRFDLLSTFFVLAGMLAFARSRKSARRRVWLTIAVISMIGGLLSKESAYSFPLLAALLVACSSDARKREAWAPVLLFGAITGVFFIYRWSILGGIGGYGPVSVLYSLKALLFRMWAILFFPVNWALPAGRWLAALLFGYAAGLAWLFLGRAEFRRLAFAGEFILLSAAPAVSQLLIGADLEKSRVLYLPSAGFCLLLAALVAPFKIREQAAAAAIVLLFHGAVLWHNLAGWKRASEVVETACTAAARCAMSTGQRPVVTGLPRTLNGVYTFANGFQECVAMQPVSGSSDPGSAAACKFEWDAASATLNRMR